MDLIGPANAYGPCFLSYLLWDYEQTHPLPTVDLGAYLENM